MNPGLKSLRARIRATSCLMRIMRPQEGRSQDKGLFYLKIIQSLLHRYWG